MNTWKKSPGLSVLLEIPRSRVWMNSKRQPRSSSALQSDSVHVILETSGGVFINGVAMRLNREQMDNSQKHQFPNRSNHTYND